MDCEAKTMKLTVRRLRTSAAAVLAFAALWASQSTASAVFVSSTADAFGLSSSLASTPVTGGAPTTANIAPVYEAMSNNPPGSNTVVGPLSFASAISPVLVVTVNSITDMATTLPAGTANGTSALTGLGLLTAGPISFSATSINTFSMVTGDVGAFTPTAGTTFAGQVLMIMGVAVVIPSSPAPNTPVNLAAAGIPNATLILNEQTLSGNGTTTRGITTNAFDLRFGVGGNTVVGGTTITGQLILGHSSASIIAAGVPEPSTFALMGIATVTLGLNYVRMRGRKLVQDAV